MGHAHRKADALARARLAYLKHPQGLSDATLAVLIDVSVSTANRYRNELPVAIVEHGKYRYIPTQDEIEAAHLILASSPEQ